MGAKSVPRDATRAARTQAGRAGSVQQRTRARQSVGRAEAAATSRRQNQWVLEELPHRPHPCRCDFHRPHGEAISDVREGEAVPPNAVHGTPSKVVRMRTRHCSAKSQASAAGSCLRSQAEVPAAGGARKASPLPPGCSSSMALYLVLPPLPPACGCVDCDGRCGTPRARCAASKAGRGSGAAAPSGQ